MLYETYKTRFTVATQADIIADWDGKAPL